MEICRVEGCDRPIKIKRERLCGMHYARWWRHGDPLAWKKPKRQVCTVEGCDLKQVALGLCDVHYRRHRRYGTTERPVRPTVCGIQDCGRAVASRGLCDLHYRRLRRGDTAMRSCIFCGHRLGPHIHAQSSYCSKDCREKELAVRRRESHRDKWLKRYGLTSAQFDDMLLAQGGRCLVCRGDQHRGRNWCVDHDHATGRVRGVLCADCNKLLGYAHDDPAILEAALAYLRGGLTSGRPRSEQR